MTTSRRPHRGLPTLSVRRRASVPRRGLRVLMVALLAALATACWTRGPTWEAVSETNRPTTYRGSGSKAAQLYRHGVNCMDVVERDACAIDYFEQLMELDPSSPSDRQLVGDAMFRLVVLYRRADRAAEGTLLLRNFWDLGSDNAGLVPYATRFLGEDMTVLYMVDMARLDRTSLRKAFSPELEDMMFTCDEQRRERLEAAAKARRLERRKAREANMNEEELRKEKARRDRFSRQRDAYRDLAEPIHATHMCSVASVMGVADPRGFDRWVAANNHKDPSKSAAVFQIDKLEVRLAAAIEQGTILEEGEHSWSISGAEYEGEKVMLARLDLRDLVLAPEKDMPAILEAFAGGRKDTLDADVSSLLDEVPRGVVFFTIFSKAAMKDSVDSLGTLGKLLPEPDGLLIASAVYRYAGVFIRMPTKNPVKASMLLGLVRLLLQRAEAEATEESAFVHLLRGVDVSQTPDGKALMMSTILAPADVEAMFLN